MIADAPGVQAICVLGAIRTPSLHVNRIKTTNQKNIAPLSLILIFA